MEIMFVISTNFHISDYLKKNHTHTAKSAGVIFKTDPVENGVRV